MGKAVPGELACLHLLRSEITGGLYVSLARISAPASIRDEVEALTLDDNRSAITTHECPAALSVVTGRINRTLPKAAELHHGNEGPLFLIGHVQHKARNEWFES
jgi:hypothetical protein